MLNISKINIQTIRKYLENSVKKKIKLFYWKISKASIVNKPHTLSFIWLQKIGCCLQLVPCVFRKIRAVIYLTLLGPVIVKLSSTKPSYCVVFNYHYFETIIFTIDFKNICKINMLKSTFRQHFQRKYKTNIIVWKLQ